ncbi:MAG: hypothetical protein HYZ26_06965 [Chloroflexi bacterium]|nr:hypothetical protein [Chloroflexota bacterium]
MTIVYRDVIFFMASVIFFLGVTAFVLGVFVLVSKAIGKDIESLRDQTAHLAQKGIADEVAGLVGNTTALVDAMNQLVRTARGIGSMLVFVGLLMMAASYFLIHQVGWA